MSLSHQEGESAKNVNCLIYTDLSKVVCVCVYLGNLSACVVLCCAVLCWVVLCCAVLCCAVLCCVVLCCAVLCCAVLCCAVLCCAVLCCAVLCCVVSQISAFPQSYILA